MEAPTGDSPAASAPSPSSPSPATSPADAAVRSAASQQEKENESPGPTEPPQLQRVTLSDDDRRWLQLPPTWDERMQREHDAAKWPIHRKHYGTASNVA
ncbi:hypothetical protein P43SY_005014 [Pythium insidiosum]|uniref:Uncharacterized protein n=1 Tax=Pythium insidiosum TaxID=114742 RepID=A0AAD5QDW4_PYTIN|nr:hypothetical protein P43SY_005014 [Pythium insidiosum]